MRGRAYLLGFVKTDVINNFKERMEVAGPQEIKENICPRSPFRR